MSTRWEERALPVLEALRTSTDPDVRDGVLILGYGAESPLGLDLPDSAVYDTLLQLSDLRYVAFDKVTRSGGGGVFSGLRVTGRGLQVTGQWPRFEAVSSPATLARIIEDLADYASPEDSSSMRRAAAAIRRIGAAGLKSAAIGVGSQLLRGALGLP